MIVSIVLIGCTAPGRTETTHDIRIAAASPRRADIGWRGSYVRDRLSGIYDLITVWET
jgi:hypothetical protein